MGAINVWQGATDAYDLAGNWSLIVPVNTNEVRIPGTSGQEIQTGLNQTAVDLASFIVEPPYAQAIGGPGNPLITSAGLVKFFGSGDFYYQDGNGTTDVMLINSGSMANTIQLGGDTITDCTLLRGTITFPATLTTMTTLRIGHVTNRESDVNLTIVAGGTALTTVYQAGGIVANGVAATTWDMAAGTTTHSGSVSITTLIQRGGYMHYTSTGTITTAWVYGGATLDLTGGRKTVTTLYRFPGSTVIMDNDLVSVGTDNDWSGGN